MLLKLSIMREIFISKSDGFWKKKRRILETNYVTDFGRNKKALKLLLSDGFWKRLLQVLSALKRLNKESNLSFPFLKSDGFWKRKLIEEFHLLFPSLNKLNK